MLVAGSITALFAGPVRANAGELSAPPPTLSDQVAPVAPVDQVDQPDQVEQTPAPVMPAGPAAPAPRVDDQLSLTGRALWDGLLDQRVSLTLINGATVGGTLVAQSHSDLALARGSDGSVVSVPKAEITGVRTRGQTSTNNTPVGNRPIDSGRSLHGGAVAMLAIGVPFGLSGTVMLGIAPGALYIHLPLLLPGIGLIVGGSIAMKRSKQRDREFRKAWGIPLAGRMQLTPSLAFTRGGGEVGFAMRF
jgi:hypothetical protein